MSPQNFLPPSIQFSLHSREFHWQKKYLLWIIAYSEVVVELGAICTGHGVQTTIVLADVIYLALVGWTSVHARLMTETVGLFVGSGV